MQTNQVPHLKGVPAIDEDGGIHPAYQHVLANSDVTAQVQSNDTETSEEGFFNSPLKYSKDFIGGAGDFLRNYTDMREANTINADKYFHCKANCQATQRGQGGKDASVLIGEGREYADEYLKGDSREACDADRAANNLGRDGAATGTCEEVCSPVRPPALDDKY